MAGKIYVLPLFTSNPPGMAISTVSKDDTQLSPFHLGPCKLYKKYTSLNMENAWQYSKVYKEHLSGKRVKFSYFVWASEGWSNPRAVRYPMGKGACPEFSFWNGERLDYIEARKTIYVPLYAEQVIKTERYAEIQAAYHAGKTITLLDYDAYNHRQAGMTLTDVLNNPNRKMGHAFVLAMLITGDKALKQIKLR